MSLKISVAGVDISNSRVQASVDLNESEISTVTFTASDTVSKAYLGTLHVNDEVIVQASKNPAVTPYQTIFDGYIEPLSSSLNAAGQTIGAVAFNKGYQLSKMRIAKEAGSILPVLAVAPVYSMSKTGDSTYIDEWHCVTSTTGLIGSDPYISKYSGITNLFGIGASPSYIATQINSYIGKAVGSWNFQLSPLYNGGAFSILELHIVACLTNNLTDGYPTPHATWAKVTPYYTIDDGATWHLFTAATHVFTVNTAVAFDPATNTYWDPYTIGGAGPIGSGYNPMTTPGSPPNGQDLYIDINGDFPYWNSNLKVKLVLSSSDGTDGGLSVALMYLKYQFNTISGYTVRQLITGDQTSQGLVPDFVDSILGDRTQSSGYTALNTDYVVTDPYNAGMDTYYADYLIPYIKFPYEDTLNALQDIVKYASALQFIAGSAGRGYGCGYHWIIDSNGKLLVAPTTNHHVAGIDNSHYVDTNGGWILRPNAAPIAVKEKMITQAFKTEPPIANYVLVAGRFMYPLNDDFCRDPTTTNWMPYYHTAPMGYAVTAQPYNAQSGQPAIHFAVPGGVTAPDYINFIHSFGKVIDFTSLMGKDVVPQINFWIRCGGSTNSYRLQLLVDDGSGNPYTSTLFNIEFASPAQDIWGYVSIPLPNTLWQTDYGGWSISNNNFLGYYPITLDWSDLAKIKYFAVGLSSTASTGTYFEIRGFSITGTVVRGAKDSESISGPITVNGHVYPDGFGCRMLTIKDSFAMTDSLGADSTSPLALEAAYQLQRYRKVRTTGQITVPFDPQWRGGQQAYIKTEVSPSGTYKIDGWMRITKATHTTTPQTLLTLTDDLTSSIAVDTSNVYTVQQRRNDPDFQSKSTASLKSGGDFDLGLKPIVKDYPSSIYTQ